MKQVPLKKQSIIPRIDGISRDIKKLEKLSSLSIFEFSKEDNFALAQFYLRRALEGVLHIGAHILSRKEGVRSTQYKDIAKSLGEIEVVDRNYATNQLTKMAGYRNRLTHFYADITPEELYDVVKKCPEDFGIFLKAIKKLLENPKKFGFTIEN